MSQLERQNDEMEEFGRQIEQELRDAEGSELPRKHHTLSRTLKMGRNLRECFSCLHSDPGGPFHAVVVAAVEREERTHQKDHRTQSEVGSI